MLNELKFDERGVVCLPQPSIFVNCFHIIPTKTIRLFSWFYWITGLIGNFFALIHIILKKNQTYRLYRLCLSVSDLMLVFYLFGICIADQLIKGTNYLINERKWRYGLSCKLLGSSVSFSLIFSMFNILYISIERLEAILYPLKKNITKEYSVPIIFVSFLFSLFIGILPIFLYKVIPKSKYLYISLNKFVFQDFYSKGSLCINIYIKDDQSDGWLYSFTIFGILLFISSLLCLSIYLKITINLRRDLKRTKFRESGRVKNISFSVCIISISNALCWAPISILCK